MIDTRAIFHRYQKPGCEFLVCRFRMRGGNQQRLRLCTVGMLDDERTTRTKGNAATYNNSSIDSDVERDHGMETHAY